LLKEERKRGFCLEKNNSDNGFLKNWQFWFAIIGSACLGTTNYADLRFRVDQTAKAQFEMNERQERMDQKQDEMQITLELIKKYVGHDNNARLSCNDLKKLKDLNCLN